jgi:hypothetical protein
MTRIECPTATAAFLLADAAGQPPVLGRQVGVTTARRRPGTLDEHLTQPAVAPGRLTRAALATGAVVARTAASPGGQLPGGREHRHVHPDLGKDRLRGPLTDPGNGVQPVPSPGERGEHPVDVGVELGDRGLQLPQVRHGQADEQRVVATKRPRSPWPSWGSLARSRPLASSASTPGSRSPATSAGEHRPPRGTQHVSGDRVQLDAGVLQGLLDALALRGVRLEPAACGSGPGSRSSRIGAGGTKLPRSSPCSNSPGQPGGVADVGLAAGQDPGRGGR